jgi:transposase
MKKLTNDQKIALELQLKRARDASERNRLCVILGHNEGLSIEVLAKALRLSHSTVCAYLNDFDSKEKTQHAPKGGMDPKLTDEQSQSLSKHLNENTYLKVKFIRAYVRKEFGVLFSRSGMTSWLQSHGFVFKRPRKVPGKLDPQLQEEFIRTYKELKDSLKTDEEIYFIDAVHPEHQSQAVCGWIKRGVQKTLQTTGKQLRVHIAGAVCLPGMKVFAREYKTVDADAMIDFFKGLESFSKATKVHVILDNAKSNKNRKLEEFLRTSRIEVHYLPPYSPNLNPIERLWKIMRETKLYNRYYESSARFFQEIRNFFKEDVPKLADILISRITDNFQAIRIDPLKISI